jgi:hypothetical protein
MTNLIDKTFLSVVLSGVLGFALSAHADELTLGLVQAKISKGMTQGEVATEIGSPNIASKDRDGNEVWIYDKVSTETHTDQASEGQSTGVGVGGVFTHLGLGFGHSESDTKTTTTTTTSKKTLTVIIRFGRGGKVSEVNYHMSKF